MIGLNNSSKIISSSIIRKKINSDSINNKEFQNLLLTREEMAQKKNLPKNWVFKDDEISNVIKNKDYSSIKNNKNLNDGEKKILIKSFEKIRLLKDKKNTTMKTSSN